MCARSRLVVLNQFWCQDIIIIACNLTPSTKGMVNRRRHVATCWAVLGHSSSDFRFLAGCWNCFVQTPSWSTVREAPDVFFVFLETAGVSFAEQIGSINIMKTHLGWNFSKSLLNSNQCPPAYLKSIHISPGFFHPKVLVFFFFITFFRCHHRPEDHDRDVAGGPLPCRPGCLRRPGGRGAGSGPSLALGAWKLGPPRRDKKNGIRNLDCWHDMTWNEMLTLKTFRKSWWTLMMHNDWHGRSSWHGAALGEHF